MDCTATFPSAMEINQVPVTILNNALVGKTVNQNTKSHSDSLVILNVGFKKKKKKRKKRKAPDCTEFLVCNWRGVWYCMSMTGLHHLYSTDGDDEVVLHVLRCRLTF